MGPSLLVQGVAYKLIAFETGNAGVPWDWRGALEYSQDLIS